MMYLARAIVESKVEVIFTEDPSSEKWWLASDMADDIQDMEAALQGRDRLENAVRQAGENAEAQRIELDARDLVCPVDTRRKVLAVGLNYRDHAEEVDVPIPDDPFVFLKASNSLNGPYDEIVVDSRIAKQPDYEVELAFVMGRDVNNATPSEGRDAIGGYMVANDFSAREWYIQSPWLQWLRCKGQDGFCPLGPWITPPDAVDVDAGLDVRCWVNGELRQDSSTLQFVFGVGELVSFISRGVTLNTGDVVLTGTPGGVALGMPNQPWLEDGDLVACEVANLGTIENRITVV